MSFQSDDSEVPRALQATGHYIVPFDLGAYWWNLVRPHGRNTSRVHCIVCFFRLCMVG